MMNYEMFVEELKNKISAAINIPIENIEFSKDGDRFSPTGDRLLVKIAEHDDAYEICGIHTKELFREFLNGTSFDTILDSTVRDIRHLQGQNSYEKTKKIWNYETVKDSLFIRLLNYDDNSKELSNAVYKRIGDIAQVLYMKVSECDGNIMSTKIFKSVVEKWKEDGLTLSEGNILEEALRNTERMYPPRIYRWDQMLFNPEYEGEEFMSPGTEEAISQDLIGNCLTTAKKTNGAVAIFYPGVAERFADVPDSDLYLVFTSVHEVMVHKADAVDAVDLSIILQDTLEEATPKEDFLTRKIYKYEKDTHRFLCAI